MPGRGGRRRDRLTVGFRFVLALPHALLVGLPAAAIISWPWVRPEDAGGAFGGGGALGAVAFLGAFFAWCAIVVAGRHPRGLRDLAAWYLRWRVNAVACVALLRDASFD